MWNTFILNPLVNLMIWFYGIFGRSYILAILALTVLIRLLLYPLMAKQTKSTAAMQELQPKLDKLKEKYKGEPEKLQEETTKLYQESGINPLGGCLPSLIQFPILIGLYQAITRSLATSPMQLIDLSQHLYSPLPSWLSFMPDPTRLLPLDSKFAWMDLASPDPLYILPILVVVSTWLYQKMMTPPSSSTSQTAQMSNSMNLMMPLLMGWMSLTFPTGLSIYWVVGNVISFFQYLSMGRASMRNLFGTEDGSFSWRGLLGLPAPAEEQKPPTGRSGSRRK